MKIPISIVFMLALYTASIASPPKQIESKAAAEFFCQTFLEQMVKGKVDEAFAFAQDYWGFAEQEFSSLHIQTVKQLGLVAERFGKPLSFEFVKKESVGDFLYRITAVIKHENHLIRWIFIFYKPEDTWLLNSFKWDDDIDQLFDDE